MKTEKVLEEISKIYLRTNGVEPKIEQKGSWINVAGIPYRKSTLENEIKLHLSTLYNDHDDRKIYDRDEDDGDIRKLASAIKQDGRHIFMSNDLKKIQIAGKRIAKMAKRILNLLGDE